MLYDFAYFIAIVICALLWTSPREERFTLLGTRYLVYGLVWYFIVVFLAWVLIFLNGLEFFFALFGVASDAGYVAAFFSDIRHQRDLLSAVEALDGSSTSFGYWVGVQKFFFDMTAYTPSSNMCGSCTAQVAPQLMSCFNTSFLVACFITISVFFSLMLTRQSVLALAGLLYLVMLTVISVLFIFATSLFVMFICFECLLLLAIGLLKLTSKSERIGEAVSEMFM